VQIVLREFGGLGNQFFRYAALRYLSKLYGAEMKISVDPEWNAQSHGYPRPCLLQHYQIRASMGQRTLRERILFTEKRWLRQVATPLAHALRSQLYSQDPSERYVFVANITLRRNVQRLYILGYWHTYRLVEAVGTELRSELTLKDSPKGNNLSMLKRIHNAANSVSIHIRRGDCKIPATHRTELPFTYYENAIATVRQRLGDATFFVFSDDVAFVREYLPRNLRAIYVDHNDDYTAHEDMRLMSSCRHHIIANSTFSWWGAWLNNSRHKLVVAPKQWDATKDSYHPDLLPPEWVLLNVTQESYWPGEISDRSPGYGVVQA
jgi:Glycosyl transferase family 11